MVKEGEEFCKATILIKKESMDKIIDEYKDKLDSHIIFEALKHRGLDVCEVETQNVEAKLIPKKITYENIGNGYSTIKHGFNKFVKEGEKEK